MDFWQLLTRDHANIADLCGEIPRAGSGGGVRSRERLFSELDGELRRHIEAEEESLYDALEDHDRTERLIDELEDEHEEIEALLDELAHARSKGTREWLMRFRDLAALVEEHFHREEHELLPAAREILSEKRLHDLRHEYAEEKIEALHAARRWREFPSSGLLLGTLFGAAAGALAYAAWRSGKMRDLMDRSPGEILLSRSPVLSWAGSLLGMERGGSRQRRSDVLRDIAKRTRTSVNDVSARLQLPIGTTYAVVAELERQGLVRPVPHEGPARQRVIAITSRGREAVFH